MAIMGLYSVGIYLATKHKMRKLKKKPEEINKNYKPFISIMIPAHNESSVIRETVNNILAVDYDNYEIILIDDRSTDDTAEVIKELALENQRIKYLIREKNAFPGKSAVLNDALSLSTAEAVLIFDADARINPDFITNLIPKLEPDDVGAVQARKVISNRNDNFLTRCQDNEMALDTHFQLGRDTVKGAVELRGNGELIKRVALDDIGGWNNYTITDDLDMSTRMHINGWDIRFCYDVCVYEEGVEKIIPLLRQRRRWVEGSIRRYLENFWAVLFSEKMSLRVSLDMTAYICQFLLPVWFFSEIYFQVFRYIKEDINTLLSSLILSVLVFFFFFSGLVYSLRKYNHLKLFENIKQSFETCVYFLLLWFPIVIFIIFKIIFTKKTMDWGKTEHGKAKS
jgi:1,2-diacylglycerol 3-beta-glucosyltransferase